MFKYKFNKDNLTAGKPDTKSLKDPIFHIYRANRNFFINSTSNVFKMEQLTISYQVINNHE